jgi:hypothetical protein
MMDRVGLYLPGFVIGPRFALVLWAAFTYTLFVSGVVWRCLANPAVTGCSVDMCWGVNNYTGVLNNYTGVSNNYAGVSIIMLS